MKKLIFIVVIQFALLSISIFIYLILPVFNSYISVKLFVRGTTSNLVAKNLIPQELEKINQRLYLDVIGVTLDIGYANNRDYLERTFREKDYPKVMLRQIFIALFMPICFITIMFSLLFILQMKFKIAKLLSCIGIIISVSAMVALPYDRYYAVDFFFTETVQFFAPLKVRPDLESYSLQSTIAFAAMASFVLSLVLAFARQKSSDIKLQP